MTFKKELIQARDFKNYGNFKQALELFEKLYNENPDGFTYKQKVDYAWTIIKVKTQDKNDLDSLIEAAECITGLLPQADMNVSRGCPYTTAVYKVLVKLFHDGQFIEMIPWLEKIDPDLLDDRPYRSYGKLQRSRREEYYSWASKAYLENMEFEKCIEVSMTGLNAIRTYHETSDTWLKWRIAKSLKEMNRFREALPYFLEVIKVKHEWHMYRDTAECYYMINKPYVALDYICPAVLSSESSNTKVNIYRLCYNVFKSFNPEMALKHAQLYYMIMLEKGYSVPYDIEGLNIDESQLNRKQLEREITELWTQYKYKNHKRCYGKVIEYDEHESSGLIETDDNEKIAFNKNEFKGDAVLVGQQVSFYMEDNPDKSGKLKKAVIVRGE